MVADVLEAVPRLGVQEYVRIDGSAEELVGISQASLGPDGVIALDQGLDHGIVVYDRLGNKRGGIGRRGQGPGEFTQITQLGWTGDTLWVWDASLRRITTVLVRPSPQLLGTVLLDRLTSAAQLARTSVERVTVTVVGFDPDTSAILMLSPRPRQPTAAVERVLGRATSSRPLGVLTRYRDPLENVVLVTSQGAWLDALVPWVMRPTVDVADDGSRLTVVTVESEDDVQWRFHVVMQSTAGDTIYEVVHPFRAIPIPRAIADSALRERAKFSPAVERAFPDLDLSREYLKLATVPPIYPPLASALIGRDGTLWLRLEREYARSPADYLVLGVEGDPVARVSLDRGYVIGVEAPYVWALEHDSFRVPSVVIHTLAGSAVARPTGTARAH